MEEYFDQRSTAAGRGDTFTCACTLTAQPLRIVQSLLDEGKAGGLPAQVQLLAATRDTLTKEIPDADALVTPKRVSEESLTAARKLR